MTFTGSLIFVVKSVRKTWKVALSLSHRSTKQNHKFMKNGNLNCELFVWRNLPWRHVKILLKSEKFQRKRRSIAWWSDFFYMNTCAFCSLPLLHALFITHTQNICDWSRSFHSTKLTANEMSYECSTLIYPQILVVATFYTIDEHIFFHSVNNLATVLPHIAVH